MNDEDHTQIGKIAGSNSHIDYICEIYSKGMRENPPDPTDYEFGQFVYIEKEVQGEEYCFVGVIYNTQIVDPDQGRTGPRLSNPEEQEIFQPSYVDEKQVLAGIALLGHVTVEDGEIEEVDHSIPRWTLEVDDVVSKLPEGFAEDILSQILERLKQEKPGEADALDVIQRNLEWQTKMEGM